MKSHLVQNKLPYDGTQLSSLWAYKTFGIQGDSIIAFRGPCQVKLEHMVDQEDVLAGDHIYSEDMMHFIAEHFELDLEKTVIRQRLLITIIKEVLERNPAVKLRRDGDDIYLGEDKLSVSIATLTRVSTMIHTGLNISSRNTPVATVSLPELGVEDWESFAHDVVQAYCEELESIKLARCKVRGVD
ncbi:MAG: DUF366 family protein [Clostridia bacterium]|nr:DUF366 family protein [Clostridia bacterium]